MNAYIALVRRALLARVGFETITEDDMVTVALGFRYGVGPIDCACQIIADRADAMRD